MEEKIERAIDKTEADSLAFVVSKKWQNEVGAPDFVKDVLGLDQEQSPREAALEVHNTIFATSIQEINNRKAQEPTESEKLEALRKLLSSQHENTLESFKQGKGIYLGGVPKNWLPNWVN